MSGKTRRSRSEARFFGDARTMNGQHFDSLESRDTLGVGPSHQVESQFDEDKDAEYTGPRTYYAEGELGKDYCEAHKYRMQSEAKCRSIKVDGFEYTGNSPNLMGVEESQRTGSKKRSRETKRETLYIGKWWRNRAHRTILECPKSVTSCTIRTKTCSTRIACTSTPEVGEQTVKSEIHSRCFDASFEYHKFFNGWLCGFGTWTHRVHTKRHRSRFCAHLWAHLLYGIRTREIKKDLNADLPF